MIWYISSPAYSQTFHFVSIKLHCMHFCVWAHVRQLLCPPTCGLSHNETSGVACYILFVYLMFTWLWPLPTLYFIWMVMDWQTPERGKVNVIIHQQHNPSTLSLCVTLGSCYRQVVYCSYRRSDKMKFMQQSRFDGLFSHDAWHKGNTKRVSCSWH